MGAEEDFSQDVTRVRKLLVLFLCHSDGSCSVPLQFVWSPHQLSPVSVTEGAYAGFSLTDIER